MEVSCASGNTALDLRMGICYNHGKTEEVANKVFEQSTLIRTTPTGEIRMAWSRDSLGKWHELGTFFVQRKVVPAGQCVNFGINNRYMYDAYLHRS
jgi:hypothetical protein